MSSGVHSHHLHLLAEVLCGACRAEGCIPAQVRAYTWAGAVC